MSSHHNETLAFPAQKIHLTTCTAVGDTAAGGGQRRQAAHGVPAHLLPAADQALLPQPALQVSQRNTQRHTAVHPAATNRAGEAEVCAVCKTEHRQCRVLTAATAQSNVRGENTHICTASDFADAQTVQEGRQAGRQAVKQASKQERKKAPPPHMAWLMPVSSVQNADRRGCWSGRTYRWKVAGRSCREAVSTSTHDTSMISCRGSNEREGRTHDQHHIHLAISPDEPPGWRFDVPTEMVQPGQVEHSLLGQERTSHVPSGGDGWSPLGRHCRRPVRSVTSTHSRTGPSTAATPAPAALPAPPCPDRRWTPSQAPAGSQTAASGAACRQRQQGRAPAQRVLRQGQAQARVQEGAQDCVQAQERQLRRNSHPPRLLQPPLLPEQQFLPLLRLMAPAQPKQQLGGQPHSTAHKLQRGWLEEAAHEAAPGPLACNLLAAWEPGTLWGCRCWLASLQQGPQYSGLPLPMLLLEGRVCHSSSKVVLAAAVAHAHAAASTILQAAAVAAAARNN